MSQTRVLMVIPTATDGTSLYRGVMPMAQLQKHDVNLVFVDPVTWATLCMVDVVFMQRPYKDQHVAVARLAHNNRKPIWVDYDDDLLAVPRDNPASKVYGSPKVQKNILDILELADVCTVSTKQLGESLRAEMTAGGRKHIPQFRVIPNALNTGMWHPTLRELAEKENEKQKCILWRGSDTHQRDVMQWVPDIIEAAHRHPDWVWLFVGMNPWMLDGHMPEGRLLHKDGIDPIEFMDMIRDLSPGIMHVPLHDSRFNRSKSNIAWIEGTWSGAAVIGPDWPEWQRPGMTTYDGTPGSLRDAICTLIETPDTVRSSLANLSWAHVTKECSLAQTTKFRLNILRELTSG